MVAEVRNFITDPPQYRKYEAFKKRVVREFQDNEDKHWRMLLNQAELGEQRPSRFLRRLK